MGAQARVVASRGASLLVLRARQWIHFVVLPLAGGIEFAPLAIAALLLSYAYGLNAISDRATDLDERKNPLLHVTDCRAALALVLVAGGAALTLSLLLSPVVRAAAAISLASATVYSVGPRAKRVPVLGTLLNLGIFAPLLWLGRERPLAIEVVAFAVLLLQNQLLHERADAAEDAAAGVRSTAWALGERGTMIAIFVLAIVGIVGSIELRSLVGVIGIVASSTLPLLYRAARERRVAHRWIAFAAGAAIFIGAGA
jgi:4-hydroxybenzoate polyprenyltransferase